MRVAGLAGQTHDAQGSGAQSRGHGVPQPADHAGTGARVHDHDGERLVRPVGTGGVLLTADDLSEPVHRLKDLRSHDHRDLAVGGGGHQLTQCSRGPQPVQLPTARPVAACGRLRYGP